MPTLKLHLKKKVDDSYKIIIEPGIIENLSKHLKKHQFGQKYCLITDDGLKKTYGEKLVKILNKARIKTELLSIPRGENSKNWQTIKMLAEQMLKKNISRKDCVITLGGGVIGDIGGFVASIYMRGIPYIHIPTSLLAMVDSSIGGKTGVNLDSGKNLLGSIIQPKIVFIDSYFLETVPIKEIQNGLAEVIKHAVIADKHLFYFLEKHVDDIFKPKSGSKDSLNHKILNKIISWSSQIKINIVETDETENYERMFLNYGHTYGHAIEKASHFKIPHGQAISIGMCLINNIGLKFNLLKKSDAERVKNLLKKTGLPTELPKTTSLKELNQLIKYDKKASGHTINFVIPRKIGQAEIVPMRI